MQGIFRKENTDKALKYGIYRHLPTYEKIIRNLVSFLIINSPAILWYVYMVIGIVCLLLAFNAKSFQKFVLKKAELLLDKSFRTGIVEYHFDAEGIETISQMGYSKNYWTAFKEYGTMGQYIYVKRKDNKMVLIDKNDLSTGELEELTQLLLNNVKM